MEREQTAYSSLLTLIGAILADPEPMPARLVCGCITLTSTSKALLPELGASPRQGVLRSFKFW